MSLKVTSLSQAFSSAIFRGVSRGPPASAELLVLIGSKIFLKRYNNYAINIGSQEEKEEETNYFFDC